MADTPTSRSLDFLRKQGYEAAVVEQTIRYPDKKEPSLGERAKTILREINKLSGANVAPTAEVLSTIEDELSPKMVMFKRDLFNFCDIIAVRARDNGTTYVQTTTRDNQAARIKKLIECEAICPILAAGNTVLVHGWAQVGPRGARKLWKVTVQKVTNVNGSMQVVLVEDPAYEQLTVAPGKERDGQNSLFTQEEPF